MRPLLKKAWDMMVFTAFMFLFWFTLLWTAIENLPE